jgi:hypothetical protein
VGKIFRVFDGCAGHLREPAEEVGERGRELVAADEPAVVAKLMFDAVVVEDSQSNRRLADSASAKQGNGGQILRKGNDLLDQIVTSEENSRWWGRQLPTCSRCRYETVNSARANTYSITCTEARQ